MRRPRALMTIRFEYSRLHPGVFNHRAKDVYIVAHVDDLLVEDLPPELVWVERR